MISKIQLIVLFMKSMTSFMMETLLFGVGGCIWLNIERWLLHIPFVVFGTVALIFLSLDCVCTYAFSNFP